MKIIPTLIITTAVAFVLIGAACVLVLDGRLVLGGALLIASVSIVGVALLKARKSEQIPAGMFDAVKESARYSNYLLFAFAVGAASIWAGTSTYVNGNSVMGGAIIVVGLGLASLLLIRSLRKFRTHVAELRK